MTLSIIHNRILILLGSFLAQIIQVGVFALFLSQKLNGLEVSLSLIGWFVGIQWMTVLLVAPAAPRLGAYFGLKRLCLISCVVTLAGLLCAYTDNQISLAIASALLGAGLIMRWVACDALVVQVAEPSKVGRFIGLHETLMGFGIAVGPLFFIWLALDWVLYAMIVIAMLSMLSFSLIGKSSQQAEIEKHASMKFHDLFIIKIVLLMALVGGFIEMATVAFFPFYFETYGFALSDSAWFVSAFGLGGTILQLPLGYLADKIGYRKTQLMACSIAILAFAGLFYSTNSFPLIMGVLFVLGGAVGALNTLAVIQAGSEVKANKIASVMTYIAIAYTFGSIVGSIITANTLFLLPADTILLVYSAAIITVVITIMTESKRPAN